MIPNENPPLEKTRGEELYRILVELARSLACGPECLMCTCGRQQDEEESDAHPSRDDCPHPPIPGLPR